MYMLDKIAIIRDIAITASITITSIHAFFFSLSRFSFAMELLYSVIALNASVEFCAVAAAFFIMDIIASFGCPSLAVFRISSATLL
ncbi:hypothetical protein SDC9_191498 [bioreactor metagenome]|uniref:Uncharacterized protein n=1 Tax=bioreactor metagenome TaxID=1076179 RepID=A0A645HY54_9ZZZZ